MHSLFLKTNYYLRQVNGVNGGDTVFVRRVSVCLCSRARAQRTSQSDQFKTVKATVATDFKYDMHVSRDSPDMTLKNFPKVGVARVT